MIACCNPFFINYPVVKTFTERIAFNNNNNSIKYFVIFSKTGFSHLTTIINNLDGVTYDYEYLNQYLPQKYLKRKLPFGFGFFSYANNPLSNKPSGHLALDRIDNFEIIVIGASSPIKIFLMLDNILFSGPYQKHLCLNFD